MTHYTNFAKFLKDLELNSPTNKNLTLWLYDPISIPYEPLYQLIEKNTNVTQLRLCPFLGPENSIPSLYPENFISNLLEALEKNYSLTTLVLEDCIIPEEESEKIQRLLTRNRKLVLEKKIEPKIKSLSEKVDDLEAFMADVEAQVQLAFHAVFIGDIDLLYTLILDHPELIRHIHDQHYTLLHHAAGLGQLDCVKLLLEKGADINSNPQQIQNFLKYEGETPIKEERIVHIGSPLYEAIAGGHSLIVELLLIKGADPAEKRGGTPSLFDVKDVEIAQLLLNYGANINDRDERGNSILHDSSRSLELLQLYIKAKANINALNENGSTPLHELAKSMDKSETVIPKFNLLVKAGADLMIRDKEGRPPYEIAILQKKDYQDHFKKASQAYTSLRVSSRVLAQAYRDEKNPENQFLIFSAEMVQRIARDTAALDAFDEETREAIVKHNFF